MPPSPDAPDDAPDKTDDRAALLALLREFRSFMSTPDRARRREARCWLLVVAVSMLAATGILVAIAGFTKSYNTALKDKDGAGFYNGIAKCKGILDCKSLTHCPSSRAFADVRASAWAPRESRLHSHRSSNFTLTITSHHITSRHVTIPSPKSFAPLRRRHRHLRGASVLGKGVCDAQGEPVVARPPDTPPPRPLPLRRYQGLLQVGCRGSHDRIHSQIHGRKRARGGGGGGARA